MPKSTVRSLFLLGLAASQASVGQASISESSNYHSGLRASAGENNNNDREYKRQSVIRRLYGPENGEVRKHVRLLEEKSERAKTGFLSDPNHEVPYENHPYQATLDRRRKQRGLQDTGFTNSNTVEQGTINTGFIGTVDGDNGEDPYKPLRITFETQALDDRRDANNAAKIDFIKTEILPA